MDDQTLFFVTDLSSSTTVAHLTTPPLLHLMPYPWQMEEGLNMYHILEAYLQCAAYPGKMNRY